MTLNDAERDLVRRMLEAGQARQPDGDAPLDSDLGEGSLCTAFNELIDVYWDDEPHANAGERAHHMMHWAFIMGIGYSLLYEHKVE